MVPMVIRAVRMCAHNNGALLAGRAGGQAMRIRVASQSLWIASSAGHETYSVCSELGTICGMLNRAAEQNRGKSLFFRLAYTRLQPSQNWTLVHSELP